MKMVLFCHPDFLPSQSMPRFAHMLKSSYEARGHQVEIWSPRARFYKLMAWSRLAKWAGYVDQYLLFPRWVRAALRSADADTLYVFCDQALGPWIPLIGNRPHVVHVHDMLALRSALGDIKENPTSLTGRIYQRYIRRGFRHARHFISVSKKTRDDLHRFGNVAPTTSEYVYNALSYPYRRLPESDAREILQRAGLPVPPHRMLLHLGGGQWYKNLPGVVAIYAQYARQVPDPLPLWCISRKPSDAVKAQLAQVPKNGQVFFYSNLENRTLQAAYSYARVFLLPSLAEGFGWPIIEALACGCPVITTGEPPMNEVAGGDAHYIPRLQAGEDLQEWAARSVPVLREVLSAATSAPAANSERANEWAARFSADKAIEAYLSIYERILRAQSS
jgi:glycosyltransferase involved in cell wall biosynthesis